MQKTLFNNNTVAKNTNLFESFKINRILLLVILFSFNLNLYSQQDDSSQENLQTTVVLKNGAKLYSADNNFNQQILTGKVILKNSDIAFLRNSNAEHYLSAIARTPSKQNKKDFSHQLKLAEDKRQKETLQKIQKEIEKYEEKKETFRKINFSDFPSPNQFFSSNTIAKNYVAPSQHHHDFSKFHISTDAYVITRALDFLHAQKYTYYNNKSLDFCFSEVFSVRPPPVLG